MEGERDKKKKPLRGRIPQIFACDDDDIYDDSEQLLLLYKKNIFAYLTLHS